MVERRLFIIAGMLLGIAMLYLVWHLRAPYGFILPLRLTKLAALAVVGASAGVAMILFQTVSAIRLLTPGIVGFDALFVFIQTSLVLALDSTGYATLPDLAQFAV